MTQPDGAGHDAQDDPERHQQDAPALPEAGGRADAAAGPPAAVPPEDDAEAERAARRVRVWVGGAALAVVAVIVAVVLAVGAFDDPTEGATRTTVAGVELAGTAETRRLLAGIAQDGTLLGNPDAPVTIHEFADLKCPACQSYEIRQQPETIATLVRTGRANLRIHFINVIDPGQGTKDGAGLINAAYGLAAKDRLWAFVHVLYFNQGPEHLEWASHRRLRQIAAGSPGVDPTDVSVRETPASREQSLAARRLAERLGVTGTPAVYVEPRGTGRYALVPNPYEQLPEAVERASSPTAPRSVAR